MRSKLSRRGLFAIAGGAPFLVPRPAAARAPASAASNRPESALPPIDAKKIAQRVVRTLAPSEGERAILVFDPGYYQDLAAEIESELSAAGVEPLLGLTFDPPQVVEAARAKPGAVRRQDDFVAWLSPVFAKADLFLWLPARSLYSDTRLEHLVDASSVRGIHFHWILGFEGHGAEEIALLSRLYERTLLETDYAALSRSQDRLIALLRGKNLSLTSPDGTDLRMRVPSDAWFHKNDGDMSKARARSARCARDREMELPAGALRFIPNPASVEGRLVVRRVSTPDGAAEGVRFDFESGRVKTVSAAKGEDAVRKQWNEIGGDVDRVGEVVLGTNPLLAVPMPSGALPYFGYGAGAVRVSLGDNWESGGSNRTPGDRNWWLFLGDATLAGGGKTLIREGRLLAD
jgi:hypothetical protein